MANRGKLTIGRSVGLGVSYHDPSIRNGLKHFYVPNASKVMVHLYFPEWMTELKLKKTYIKAVHATSRDPIVIKSITFENDFGEICQATVSNFISWANIVFFGSVLSPEKCAEDVFQVYYTITQMLDKPHLQIYTVAIGPNARAYSSHETTKQEDMTHENRLNSIQGTPMDPIKSRLFQLIAEFIRKSRLENLKFQRLLNREEYALLRQMLAFNELRNPIRVVPLTVICQLNIVLRASLDNPTTDTIKAVVDKMERDISRRHYYEIKEMANWMTYPPDTSQGDNFRSNNL